MKIRSEVTIDLVIEHEDQVQMLRRVLDLIKMGCGWEGVRCTGLLVENRDGQGNRWFDTFPTLAGEQPAPVRGDYDVDAPVVG